MYRNATGFRITRKVNDFTRKLIDIMRNMAGPAGQKSQITHKVF
jgi:hypothetical protein